jgi:uncharacterized protein YqjF (DUF2071 family)
VFDLDAATRQARSLEQIEHRPWPIPTRPWTMGQTLDDLLLVHWRVPLDDVRARVPAELEVEQHSGSAWLGIVAFRVSSLRLRGLLPLPGLSSFHELNVRTYVRAPDGKPGVWFFSLDVSSPLVVEAARRLVRLPYFHARIAADPDGTWIDQECVRLDERGRVFNARYRPEGAVFQAKPGSLEWFLAERYCLYATDERGALQRAEFHHPPWPLQHADVEIELTSIVPLELRGAPLCHFSRRQDVVIWRLEAVL